jgi:hypothetical protein
MTDAMVDSMVEAREGIAGMTGGMAMIVADGTVVVPDGWIGVVAIDFTGIVISVIGVLTGASGKLLHRSGEAVRYALVPHRSSPCEICLGHGRLPIPADRSL